MCEQLDDESSRENCEGVVRQEGTDLNPAWREDVKWEIRGVRLKIST